MTSRIITYPDIVPPNTRGGYTDQNVEKFLNHYITPNFQIKELACKGKKCCGNSFFMQDITLCALQRLRNRWAKPLNPSSGSRCRVHNMIIGGSFDSWHLFGKAVDIETSNLGDIDLFLVAAREFFSTVIDCRERGYIHMDLG